MTSVWTPQQGHRVTPSLVNLDMLVLLPPHKGEKVPVSRAVCGPVGKAAHDREARPLGPYTRTQLFPALV